LGWWPVPLLAVVVFLIAGAQVGTVRDAGPMLLEVLPVFVGFLLVAALIARLPIHLKPEFLLGSAYLIAEFLSKL